MKKMTEYNDAMYIDELREENKAFKAVGVAQAKQIVKLEEEATNNEGVMVALREGYTNAMQRIEELEKERKAAEDLIERSQDKGFHIYTNDQINAAVEITNKILGSVNDDFDALDAAWEILNELGIERCENNLFQGTDHHGCSNCNGIGAVVKNEETP